ncbi:MAG: ABC transporter permease [Halanaeroarchaeum sp.]
MSRPNEMVSEIASASISSTIQESTLWSFLLPSDLTWKDIVFPTTVSVVVLVAWEFLIPFWGIETYLLPTPSAILFAFIEYHAAITAAMKITLMEFAIGYFSTVFAGYLLALVMAYSTPIEKTFYPYIIVIRSIPVVALLPVFLIWFGFGFNSIIVISFLISFFPMVVNTLSGFKSTDDELVDMLRSFSASPREIFRHVYLYGSLPSVFAALKICTILAFTGAIVGEFLLGKAGIGALILNFNSTVNTPAMFAAIFTVSWTELLIFGFIHKLEDFIVDWQ